MGTTKNQFLQYTYLPNSYRVYLESDVPGTVEAIQNNSHGSVYSAMDILVGGGRVLVACFDAANEKGAVDFASSCRKTADCRVVEGPEWTTKILTRK